MFLKNALRSTRTTLFSLLIPSFLLGTCLVLSGCLSASNSSVIPVLDETPSPSQIIVEHGQSLPQACVITVGALPPEPKTETLPHTPGPGYVWTTGSWRYYSRHYVWLPGSWALPPKPHAVYTPAQWTNVNGNSMFTEGYWYF